MKNGDLNCKKIEWLPKEQIQVLGKPSAQTKEID